VDIAYDFQLPTFLESLSKHWMNFGTMSNGRCLTANITEHRKTEIECSLWDILEPTTKVEKKYYLSDTQAQKLLNYQGSKLLVFRDVCS
jgi:hypothetical protein